jgi:hypothetical protein
MVMNTEVISWGLVTILSISLFISMWSGDQVIRERDKALKQRNELSARLTWIQEYLDEHMDTDDGHDGQPVGNWAMQMSEDVCNMIGKEAKL